MFEQIQERKNLLEEIEQKTSEYEKILRNYNIRELMFRYQYINQYKDEISKLEIKQQNNQIQLKDLEDKKKISEIKVNDMRKRLSDVENKNHSITESLNKMENDRIELNKKIDFLEKELSELKKLQLLLKIILPQMENYFKISDEDSVILQNISETDFESEKKISTFIDFSKKNKKSARLVSRE